LIRRLVLPLLIAGCFLTLLLTCYGAVLLGGRQLAFRDGAHFYYPLYKLVQDEWDAGRWPLWEPEENGGMPLLGNPAAAVLYPGKIVYAVLPYAWGARLYAVAHTALAFVGMVALLRGWGTSWVGAALGGLSYAFGAPILSQECNIIYLVGAAWLPLGFRAADRWLRLGRRWGLLELTVVLAMQFLGGDPEAAYVLGLCAGGYALGLAWADRPAASPAAGASRSWQWPGGRRGGMVAVAAAAAVIVAWVAASLILARWLPSVRKRTVPPSALPGMTWLPPVVSAAWVAAGLFVLGRWWRRRHARGAGVSAGLGPMLAGLAGSAALAAALAAAQLVPVLEFIGRSARARADEPHDLYPFSLEPVRLVELIWPNAFGVSSTTNRNWLTVLPPRERHAGLWVPSLYLGGLALVFAVAAIGWRGGPPWRAWLSAVALVSLGASLGEYASPLGWARWLPACARQIGPHDPLGGAALRSDGFLRDGDGGFYWLLATALPGFRQFRYPSKLLSFTAVAAAGLAGLGWDRVAAGRGRRAAAAAAGLLAVSIAALAVAAAAHDRIVAVLAAGNTDALHSAFAALGPFDAEAAVRALRRTLVQAVIVYAIALVLAARGRSAVGMAGAIALIAATADLAGANARFVLSVDQRLLETPSQVVRLIEAAERADPARGPFRVHRMPSWGPPIWQTRASRARIEEFVAWERDTIRPKYGLLDRLQYTLTYGVAELSEYESFFAPSIRPLAAELAPVIGAVPGQPVVMFPRRAFDLWNTRYFVLPALASGWLNEDRSFVAFLARTAQLYPEPATFEGPEGPERKDRWLREEDFHVRRNTAAFPRVWIVHGGRSLTRLAGLGPSERLAAIERMLSLGDRPGTEPHPPALDPLRTLAYVEADRRKELAEYLPGTHPRASESASITSYGPQRVEIDAVLDQPGLVVLADVDYPGWQLTIDDHSAPIYRANHLMRGAAVKSGRHHLVYTYQPRSFQVGVGISLAGLAALVVLGVAFYQRPISSRTITRSVKTDGPDPKIGDLLP
jgi:hypothetical protein